MDQEQITVNDLPDDAVLIDVREQDEWDAGHAPGAVHLPMSEISSRLDEIPEHDPLYIICRVGGRSERVAQYLRQQGWPAVNVADGMKTWEALGRPLHAADARVI